MEGVYVQGRIIAPGSGPGMADRRFRTCPLADLEQPEVRGIVGAHRRELAGRLRPAPHLLHGVDLVAAASAEANELAIERAREGL